MKMLSVTGFIVTTLCTVLWATSTQADKVLWQRKGKTNDERKFQTPG